MNDEINIVIELLCLCLGSYIGKNVADICNEQKMVKIEFILRLLCMDHYELDNYNNQLQGVVEYCNKLRLSLQKLDFINNHHINIIKNSEGKFELIFS